MSVATNGIPQFAISKVPGLSSSGARTEGLKFETEMPHAYITVKMSDMLYFHAM